MQIVFTPSAAQKLWNYGGTFGQQPHLGTGLMASFESFGCFSEIISHSVSLYCCREFGLSSGDLCSEISEY